jgi:glutamate---cysteine ligase / carboxylate-amine ligase
MLEFKTSEPLTMGVELELQLLDARTGALSRGAGDLISLVHRKAEFQPRITPEITESMIELNTSVHTKHDALLAELRILRDALCAAGDKLNIALSGGGAHPFSVWSERRIFPTERFVRVSQLYGYLAKQFTVFGQHVHIGCPSGDAAIALTQQLHAYIPYFVALSAASPYAQNEDTLFETSRLHAVAMFPLSGHMPRLTDWQAFNTYFEEMHSLGIVGSIKDFYWDIRPKPEFGTVEVRIFDTPLTLEMAAALAAFVQTLSKRLLKRFEEQGVQTVPSMAAYRVYGYNRFQACRFGYEAMIVDPVTRGSFQLAASLEALLESLMVEAAELGNTRPLLFLQELVAARQNGASWMRAVHAQTGSLADMAKWQAELLRHSPTGRSAAASTQRHAIT